MGQFLRAWPFVRRAIDEIEGLIRSRYPDAAFDINQGEDPDGVYLWVTLDIDDADEVMDVFVDRLLEMQIEDGLDLYVISLETAERSAARIRSHPFVARPHQLATGSTTLLD